MPFEQGAPMTFNAVSVQKNAPDSSGVYGLSNANEWIFVGETTNIKQALLQHLREVGTPLASRKPKGFAFEVTPAVLRAGRCSELIRELSPSCVVTR
jgi:hypothetical protein